MKKIIGVLTVVLLLAALVLALGGMYKMFIADDPNEDGTTPTEADTAATPDITPETTPEVTLPAGTTDATPTLPTDVTTDVPTVTEPDPIPEVGNAAEYVGAFEALDGAELPSYMIGAIFADTFSVNDTLLPIKVYFGTFLTKENAENIENTFAEMYLTNENGDRIKMAYIVGEELYSGRYLCTFETADGAVNVKYIRMLDLNVPSEMIIGDKGSLTLSISVYTSADGQASIETLASKETFSIYFKKNNGVYELSGDKEETVIYNYEYTTDISKYIGFIEPTGDLWSNDYLLLVNPWNPIEKDSELSPDTVISDHSAFSSMRSEYDFHLMPGIKLNTVAMKALTAMFIEAVEETGLQTRNFQVTSSYRNYATQASIFNNNVKNTRKYVCANDDCGFVYLTKYSYSKCSQCGSAVTKVKLDLDNNPEDRAEAEASVKTYSCAPGTSEHQSGLAVDVIDRDYNTDLLEGYKNTVAGKWLAENCHKFGFILRFPEDKQDITGIVYEPWHFRYVGRYHASRMNELDMCFEEYIEFLTNEGYFDDPDSVHNPGNMEIDPDTNLILDK